MYIYVKVLKVTSNPPCTPTSRSQGMEKLAWNLCREGGIFKGLWLAGLSFGPNWRATEFPKLYHETDDFVCTVPEGDLFSGFVWGIK